MVLIDGHDSAWQRKFQTVALAVCRNSENLADVPKNSTIAVKNNPPKFSVEEERNQRKIIFMHLNLGHVPWEQLPLQHVIVRKRIMINQMSVPGNRSY
ncbi:hypothetical protein IV203_033397 [Nitzschia inconspicua]|uniref:Uncharacterized protein n=1 Tax=Nitzschia inconspicua TaxID=303405 RepID=A0A9K3K5G3_9STRA|nr:hypothetical protein IV203_033397 [Nitzschia inconspicua]